MKIKGQKHKNHGFRNSRHKNTTKSQQEQLAEFIHQAEKLLKMKIFEPTCLTMKSEQLVGLFGMNICNDRTTTKIILTMFCSQSVPLAAYSSWPVANLFFHGCVKHPSRDKSFPLLKKGKITVKCDFIIVHV